MNNTNPKVDGFFGRPRQWQDELLKLRTILLSTPLTEELKWGKPCYTFQNSNVVVILPLKEHFALLFVKGALLSDPQGILVRPTEDTQAARQLRLTSLEQIVEMEAVLKAYLAEAIEVEKAGLKVELKKITERTIPEELQSKFDEMPTLKTAFEALTPGRQRAYLLHFAAPKQAKTRESRIEKCVAAILDGKGMND